MSNDIRSAEASTATLRRATPAAAPPPSTQPGSHGAQSPTATSPAAKPRNQPGGSSARVLVVDDDPAGGRMLEAKLAVEGYQVTVAGGAAEAQQLALTIAPDIIVSDVCMPETDGVELTRWLRAQEPTATVPIVLVTSMDDRQVLARGLEAGADDFLAKPVSLLELRTRVRSLLRNKRLADELVAREQAARQFGVSAVGRVDSAVCPVATAPPPGSPADGPADDTILLIDDHDPERMLLQAFLEEVGCRVETASDGRSGLEMLDKNPVSLIVLDLVLPDINGYEVIRKTKSTPRLADIPILVVSVMSEVQDRVKALELGADDFIVKGSDPVEFRARVQRLLRLKRHHDRLNDRCDQALRQAVTDSLTGLFTHGFLKELTQREVPSARRYGQPLSALFIDIDHFKQVNDRLGHACGDHVLKAVASTVREIVRSCDTVARYGGEEFVVLMPHTDRIGASRLAERIRSTIEARSITVPGSDPASGLRVTVSIGVASFPDDANDAESLLQHADEALYSAKQSGRNAVAVFGGNGKAASGRPRLLLVDDEEPNLRLLEAYLASEQYETIKARHGQEALDLARRAKPDLILLDAIMPRMLGFDVCRRLKQENATSLIPVILVTSLSTREDKLRATEAGASDFISKPVNREELLTRVRALLRAKRSTDVLEDAETVIFTLARAVESRDPSTGGHVERVSHYAVALAKAIGLPEGQIDGLRRAGVVHDIGKIVVPDSILLKPGKLTAEERKIVERHVEAGYELLRPLRTFAESLPAVRFHHERLDGSGYPLGLKASEVPVVAQIMAIVDVYDALATDRVYRSALPRAEVFRVLREEAAQGKHDPQLIETFIRLIAEAA